MSKRNQPITLIGELEKLTAESQDGFYYIRNAQGVVCAVREKRRAKFLAKCQYYKKKYTQEELKEKIKGKVSELLAIYNYLYPHSQLTLREVEYPEPPKEHSNEALPY